VPKWPTLSTNDGHVPLFYARILAHIHPLLPLRTWGVVTSVKVLKLVGQLSIIITFYVIYNIFWLLSQVKLQASYLDAATSSRVR
jgi:hypothetical protein